MAAQKQSRQFVMKKLTQKVQRYCAYAERCNYEVRQKLIRLGAEEDTISKITTWLQSEGYLDDARFARVFANGKFQNNRWGKIRISNELMKRQIPESLISKALEEIDDQSYKQCLLAIIQKKAKELESKKTGIVKEKVAAYCVQKGFEPDLVWETLEKNYLA